MVKLIHYLIQQMIGCQHLLHLNAYYILTDVQVLVHSLLHSGFGLDLADPQLPMLLGLPLNLLLHLDLSLLGRGPLQLLMKATRTRRLAEHRR